ncbi:globin [Leptospira barantonii]|uniref:Globin n=1 Tax=Leptospira barantonii TaxID=2023184 RepID=A0ABX4NQT3_9LEPT|nr:globin [Leptospira barantonii]PJZ59209.1 globin [Leptospira barantonii]
MNLTENQFRSLVDSFEIINLDRIKFAELFFLFLKENSPKYEDIFSRLQLEEVRSFMGSARNIALTGAQSIHQEKAIHTFGMECIKLCNRADEIFLLEKAWIFAMEEWLGPWFTHEIEESWKEVFKIIYVSSSETLQWG